MGSLVCTIHNKYTKAFETHYSFSFNSLFTDNILRKCPRDGCLELSKYNLSRFRSASKGELLTKRRLVTTMTPLEDLVRFPSFCVPRSEMSKTVRCSFFLTIDKRSNKREITKALYFVWRARRPHISLFGPRVCINLDEYFRRN